jgi:xanthine dehydrogenase small subunit
VRNAGTIGGNIANGSPIGDTPPPPCPRPDRGGLQGRQALRRGYFLGGGGDFGGRHEGRITACRIAYGGMAATPRRAARAEAVLSGQPWGQAALPDDFTPLSDMRASTGYRMRVAQNLLLRFYLEQEQGAVARLSA